MDSIRVGDLVSWKRTYDDVRMYGYIVQVRGGFYMAKDPRTGLRFAVRGRDITKEERLEANRPSEVQSTHSAGTRSLHDESITRAVRAVALGR